VTEGQDNYYSYISQCV